MVPEHVTAAVFANEIAAACEWAKRERMQLDAVIPKTLLRATLVQEASGEHFYLQGRFDGYKALPPEWVWCDSEWSGHGNRRLSPEAARTPYGNSMFLDHSGRAVICAPFNRLAFRPHGGPHKNWGELTHWMSAGNGYVHAVTIADMLDVIVRDFRHTKGRMA